MIKGKIKNGFYEPKLYDFALNYCHYKRRTKKIQKRFKKFDKDIGNIKKYLPLNLKEKIIKQGFAKGIASILRSNFLLGRRDGVWVLRKAIKFNWPISLNPLSKLKKKFDISLDLAEWIGIKNDPKYCGGKIHEKTKKTRKIKRGTFYTKKGPKSKILSSLLVRSSSHRLACRLERDEVIKGKPLLTWYMDY